MRQDVVVVGGGPAGAACATALARGGARCALFERGAAPPFKPGEVINSQVQSPLRELGLWEQFLARGYLRGAGTDSAWGGAAAGQSAAIDPFGGAFLVDRADLEELLLDAASAAGVTVVRGVHISAARRRAGEWSLEVRHEESRRIVTTPLLIEASGRGRSVVGSGERERVDSLTALLAYTSTAIAPDLRLSIESTREGWWYAAALPGGQMVLAFLTDADLLPAGREAQGQYFRRQIESSQLIKKRLSPGGFAGSVRAIAATSTIRRAIGGDGWVAIGDAAATYDPLMGMGVTMALSKGLAMARLLLGESTATAVSRYEQAERVAFEDYLRARRSVYRAEARWPEEPFWRRRISRVM